jgi:hypothetical protein
MENETRTHARRKDVRQQTTDERHAKRCGTNGERGENNRERVKERGVTQKE